MNSANPIIEVNGGSNTFKTSVMRVFLQSHVLKLLITFLG